MVNARPDRRDASNDNGKLVAHGHASKRFRELAAHGDASKRFRELAARTATRRSDSVTIA
jgi:hypothetical protein